MRMLKYSGEWHSSIPAKSILRNPILSRDARLLWSILQSYASPDSPKPYPSHLSLMRDMGCKKTALKKYQSELEAKGFLEVERGGRDGGRWENNVYILCIPVSTGAAPTAPVNTATVPTATAGAAPSNHHSSSIARKERITTTTTQKKSAGADRGSGNFAFGDRGASPPGPPRELDLGEAFHTRWMECYQKWFGVAYLPKPGEARRAREVLKQLDWKPKDLLAYVFRMWINTADYDDVLQGERDPLFYQIKGSRNLLFFLKYLQEIATEQKEPLDCAVPIKDRDLDGLEEIISQGRP